ncbi:MAG TPA: metallophosphoesterase [Propionibacteriaceae bacterium]
MAYLHARIKPLRSAAVLLACAVVAVSTLTPVASATAAEAPRCGSLSSNVWERVNPATQASTLTLTQAASNSTAGQGFTSLREPSMKVAAKGGRGLVAVHRLYRARYGGDYFYAATSGERSRAIARGYTDLGVAFYASRVKASCLTAVWSYEKGGVHRFVTAPSDIAALRAAGWRQEMVRFYAGKPSVDPKFSLAVYPDTQQEVGTDRRFVNRANWLVANRSKLDLRYVTHTGDVVNWDTPDHAQYEVARKALKPLDEAQIPYSLSIGNHDSQATGVGGGARDAKRTRALFRDTTVFNAYLDNQDVDLEGAYEPGKVDNAYHVFTAGGVGWLVLNLELWPRPGAVNWAQEVVASHPKHNVVIVTHSYLTSKGAISGRSEYGDTSPKLLSDQLVKKYANVRMVLSGHTGTAAHRVDTGVHGNKIDSFLLAMHSNTTNPMRLIEIDTRANTVKSWVYAPWDDTDYPSYTVKLSSRAWVR